MSPLSPFRRTGVSALVLLALLLLAMTFGVSTGPVPIPFGRVWGIVLHQVFPDWQAMARDIAWPDFSR